MSIYLSINNFCKKIWKKKILSENRYQPDFITEISEFDFFFEISARFWEKLFILIFELI